MVISLSRRISASDNHRFDPLFLLTRLGPKVHDPAHDFGRSGQSIVSKDQVMTIQDQIAALHTDAIRSYLADRAPI
jgi:hypothetical protein